MTYFLPVVSVKNEKSTISTNFIYVYSKTSVQIIPLYINIRINLQSVFLKCKLKSLQWKERWKERESTWSLNNCSSLFSHHHHNFKRIVECQGIQDVPKPKLGSVKKIWWLMAAEESLLFRDDCKAPSDFLASSYMQKEIFIANQNSNKQDPCLFISHH